MPTLSQTQNPVQAPASLHILSGFSVGETALVDYWREQVETVKRDAVPFQVLSSSLIPSILLDVRKHSLPSTLFDATSSGLELWADWCTFMTPELDISDTFLFLSIYNRQRCRFVLRFQHHQHIPLLEAIEQTRQLKLTLSSYEYSVPFYNSELPVHLKKIHTVFRQAM